MARPDWYDATDCDTHEKGAPKFCKKSEPGEGTERSCAFDGARVVLMPITDAIHLVHGPIGCAGNSWDNRGARSSGSQLYRRGFTTELLENDVVFGGEKKLHQAILDLRRPLPRRGQGGLRLLHLRRRHDRRRRRGGLPPGRRRGGHPGHPGQHPRLRRRQEHRQPAGRRAPARPRHRHRRAGHPDPLRRQPHRRVQHRRRPVGHAAALRAAGHPHPLLHLRRRPASRTSATPTGPGSTSSSAPRASPTWPAR